ncbi:hypothetical protein FDP41_001301 [Naegleria fowleri]|uniref:C2 domain-containing protein n=1 Tax=Naegleria fowleri TaxID=5763 RepID=A0A6A5BNQ3_NAEFO|nr:uncharacterized protein FDP41_001301 [Naegleria fowleri]KAF0979633.1 hypothetical protein FDP41_001301 [Naegleria fowleri]
MMDPILNQQPQTMVELFISCSNLKNKDLMSKSDPIVSAKIGERQKTGEVFWSDLGRTEVQKNNLNPKFIKTFMVAYKFEEIQPLKFLVYDVDNESSTLADDDFLGMCEVKLSDIVCRPEGLQIPLKDKHGQQMGHGTITIRSEEKRNARDYIVNIGLAGRDLAKMDLFSKSDPFFIISKSAGNQFVDIYKSEIIMNNLNPNWKNFEITMQKLCNGDENNPIKISVFDWDKNSDPDLIGHVTTSLSQLKQMSQNGSSLTIVDDQNKKKIKNNGKIIVSMLTMTLQEEEYSFLDYLYGGLEVSLLVSIDFTGSNGNPSDPSSLHHIGKMNEYEMAIRSVGDVLSNYDSDKLFPAYGFGAKLPNGQVSHCFALNGHPENPFSQGVDGILRDYRLALNTVQLYGPTNFAPTIQTAVAYAAQGAMEQSQQNQKYFILLIITDGEITDMPETIKEIVNASRYPLSIIIVGVGSADFASMEALDSDNRRLQSGNNVAVRDIVQFVPFRQFGSQNYTLLAKETLKEVPQQVCEYFKSKKIKPKNKV